ncbi:MAG: hypothetical protein KA004_01740 [Verrucomicrobiales bacterium]|nr:hypothetical protein [Verrucomicrobiales bacterium]
MFRKLLSLLFGKAPPATRMKAHSKAPQNDEPLSIDSLTAALRGMHPTGDSGHPLNTVQLLSLGCSAWEAIPSESPFRNPHVWLELQFYVSLRFIISLGTVPTPASRAGGESVGLAAKAHAKTTGHSLQPTAVIEHFQIRQQMLLIALQMAQTKDWLASEYAGGMLFLLGNCLLSTVAGEFTLPIAERKTSERKSHRFPDGRMVPASCAKYESHYLELKKCLQSWRLHTLESALMKR